MTPIDVTDNMIPSSFKEGYALLDFFMPHCAPCRMMEPTLKTIGDDIPVQVYKINAEDNFELAKEASIRFAPTFIFLKDGEPLYRWMGYLPYTAFRKQLESMMDGTFVGPQA